MIKHLLKISLLAGTLLLLFLSMPSYAQQSMKESQKLRIQEEKRRAKISKKKDKKNSKTDKSTSKIDRKDKAQVPRAAQKLSSEGERVNQVRTRSRKGAQGLTKVAKMRKKSERKRRKSLQR